MREKHPEGIAVVESEVDAVALWTAGIPAIATGGADGWQGRWWELLADFRTVVAWIEDAGSLDLLRRLLASRQPGDPEVLVCHSLGRGAKDAGRLLARLNGNGGAVLRQVVEQSKPVRVVAEADLLDEVVAELEARPAGQAYQARCPFHDDRSPSLSLFQGADGGWAFKCHAGSCGVKGPLALLGACLGLLALGEGQQRRRRRQAGQAAARPWTPPAEAESETGATVAFGPALPPFPIGAIPEPHRTYLQQAAAALDGDVALVAVPYLAIAAGVLGCRVELQLTRSWTERAILWTAVVAPPGSAKSPALRLAMQPMLALQHEAYERWREEVARYEEEKRAYDQERAAAKRSGGGGGVPHLPPPEPPAELEHFYTADCTLEAITRMLGHPRSRTPGVTVIRDELIAWVKAFDAYSPKGERQTWLSMWAGAPVKSDRAHREPYVIPRPAVSVTGGMTPDLLPALEEESGQRDGLLERILFVMPPCRPMALVDAEIAPEVQAAVRGALRALRTCPEGTVRLSPAAYATYAAWHEENRITQERATGLLQGFAAKLSGHVARLALVLHALAHPEDPAGAPVGRETMAGAIALGEFFRAHFERVAGHFGVAAQVQDSAALRLYRALQRRGGSATGRELDDAGLRAGPERDRAVQTLQAAGLLHVTAEPHAGPGRPTLRFSLTGNLSNLSNLSGGLCVEGEDGGAASPGAGAEHERWEEFEL
jgi:hypothetical protein